MRRYLIFLLALAVLISAGTGTAFATEVTEETEYVQPERPFEYCGEAVVWSYSDGTLVLSGNGPMDDLTEFVPWEAYKDEIRTLIVTGNITYIGAYAFADYDALEDVNLGEAVTHIGYRVGLVPEERLRQVEEISQNEMGKLTAGLGIPGL